MRWVRGEGAVEREIVDSEDKIPYWRGGERLTAVEVRHKIKGGGDGMINPEEKSAKKKR